MYKTIDEIPADLRWLAENVHEWPENRDVLRTIEYTGCPTGFCSTERYARSDWISARDLISGKPGWDEAPGWAEFLFQVAGGAWFWTRLKPIPNDAGGWDCAGDSESEKAGPGRVLGDWRDTLKRRPDDLGNHLLDGDAPATFRDLNQPLVSTTVREIRINHDDGHIDITVLPDGGGVLLVDDQGGETRIPNLAALDATAAAVRRILGGES